MNNTAYKKFIIILLLSASVVYAWHDTESLLKKEYKYYISLNAGCQMSGIKREDFILSNYSPLINLTLGKWFASCLALEIGYKGYYFYYIGDNIKHHYQYYYGGAVLNIVDLLINKNNLNKWNISLHAGSGYFYNHVYNRPNICVNMGLQNNFILSNKLLVNIKVSAIMGWDIYQQNEDILPGISLGLSYLF
jgi:hypothetical protein